MVKEPEKPKGDRNSRFGKRPFNRGGRNRNERPAKQAAETQTEAPAQTTEASENGGN